MLIKNILLIACFMQVVLVGTAQNSDKIDKNLDKLFQKGKIEKVEKKAIKLKKKYPNLEVSYFYLSKVELIKYGRIAKVPNKKQWSYLRKASGYCKKLGPEYAFWKDSIRFVYSDYIKSWDDNAFQSAHLKKVVKTYSSHTGDTLPTYYFYYKKKPYSEPIAEHDIPQTTSLRTELIEFASELVGIPYTYAGETPDVGFDCSGFVKYVYQSIDIELPHNAHMQSQLEGEIIKLEDAQPGDLIFFGSRNGKTWRTQHAGIIYEYKEDEPKVIHCVSRGVSIDGNNTSWDSYWKEKILFVKRLRALD